MGVKCNECGVWTEDYLHYGWHKIHLWNEGVRKDARQKGMADFEKRLSMQEKRQQKKEKAWKPLM
jgi:hypothetical protein